MWARTKLFLASHSLPRFVLVGAIGFLIDAGLMTALHYHYGLAVVHARLCSFSIAVSTTWLLNRKITFRGSATSRPLYEWGRYTSVGILGGLLNLFIFLSLTRWAPGMAGEPIAALMIAAAFTLLFTYSGSRLVVFTGSAHPRGGDSS